MSQVPATQQDVNLNAPEGLEDFGTEDRVMPMLRIDHNKNVFVDALSNEEFPELNVILLGLVKQRVLWPAQMKADADGSEPPLCRSYNFQEGHPSPPETFANGTTQERFPWDATQFEPGTEIVPCSQCPLKDWGSHPTRDAPWCSEQHTFALVIPQADGNMVPCLFQLQRSGLKPSRQYLSSFANANQPLFTVHTQIKLDQKKYGNNPFSVPSFSRSGAVDEELYPEFSTMYRSIREYLQTPRRRDDEDVEDNLSTEVSQPAQAAPQQAPQPPAPAAPAPAPEPQQAAPAPEQAPQQAAPAATQQPAQTPAAPEQAPAPAAQQAAPQQPVEDTPQAAPAPSIGGQAPSAAAPASTDDDEIPF